MGINKICPKILPFAKIRNKNDLPYVCVFFYYLEPFGSCFGEF